MGRYSEPKYRTIQEAKENELEELKQLSADSSWKPAYHIHPQYGLINDPNGLAYFNGEFHVFYQWFPFDAYHGMKHWAHVKSTDLVNWERLPVALVPVEDYESHGAYSGASLEVDGKLYLYYTGNIKYGPEERSANQCLAIMDKNGTITKHENNPVIEGVPEGYTGHVRDPKVFVKNGRYYMLLGAQRTDLTGAIIVYESENAVDWSFKGELKLHGLEFPKNVYMLECPDYFELDGHDVLIFSPQGLQPEGHDYHNLYNVIYVLGNLDIENLEFNVDRYQELEKGFDFYAPQSFSGKNNERLLFSWAGMGEIDYPSDKEKWAHCLSIPRELRIVDGKLLQKPAGELKQLRKEAQTSEFELEGVKQIANESVQYELEVEFSEINGGKFGLELFASETEGLVLEFDRSSNTVSLNREKFEAAFGGEYGFVRSAELEIGGSVKVQVFVDRSIAEVFVNGGEVVFTSRVFPKKDSTGINVYSDGKMNVSSRKHELAQGITI